MTGVTDATLNGANAVTKLFFCSVVKFSPVVDLIDIKSQTTQFYLIGH